VDGLHDVVNEFRAVGSTGSHICAFLHHEGISEAIFQNAACNLANYVPDLPATNQESDCLSALKDFMNWFQTTEGLWDMQKSLDIIIEICLYSLIDFDPENCIYSIYLLVHAWTLTIIADGVLICTCTQYILSMSCSWDSTLRIIDSGRHFCPTLMQHSKAAQM